MRRLIGLMLVGVLLPTVLLAQSIPQVNGEMVLTKLTEKTSQSPGEQVCGDYFVLYPDHYDGHERGPGLAYFAQVQQGPQKGTVTGLFLRSKYVVYITDAKPVPTAQIQLSNGTMDKVILRMSRRDYDLSKPCIPAPTKPPSGPAI